MLSSARAPRHAAGGNMQIKKYFLIFAFCAVSVIALLYGVSPRWFAATFLDVQELDLDLAHILRAVMGLYLALGCFWLYAAFDPRYTNTAVLTTAVFSGGLVAGRIVSLFADGKPAPLLLLYVAMELSLVPLAIWVWRRPD
ncbi:MAG: hypothetical protein CTY15_10610 [Methylocystis sp.]|nr:MAG: hypothetical protein CTY15_10610 [Methylocystis sp.]